MTLKSIVIGLLILILNGCATQSGPKPLLTGYTAPGAPICFSAPDEISSVVERFYASRDLSTEEGKIDYLIERVRTAPVNFIRNEINYTGSDAAKFLRWKYGRLTGKYKIPISTASDFVNKVAIGSRNTGLPYIVVLKDGAQYTLQEVLKNELEQLEKCLQVLVTPKSGISPEITKKV